MSFSFDVKNDIVIVKVKEKRATVDISTKFKDELIQRIDNEKPYILVDLGAVEFVDSSFLGALVAGLKRATVKNGDLKIINLQQPVRTMFELTRLFKIFDIFDSEEEALKSF